MKRKVFSAMMAAAMLLSMSIPAFADTTTGSSDVTLTVTDDSCKHTDVHYVDNANGTHSKICSCGEVVATESHKDSDGDKYCDFCTADLTGSSSGVIQAVVPMSLPIAMDLKGNVYVDTSAVITNEVTDSAIKVTDITVDAKGGWQLAASTEDFSTKPSDSQVVAFKFRGDNMNSGGIFTLTEGNWNIAANDSLPLNMEAKIPIQTHETASTSIATVRFTLDWAEGSSTSNKDTGGGQASSSIRVNWDDSLLVIGGLKNADVTWTSADPTTSIKSVAAANTSIVSVTPDGAPVNHTRSYQVYGKAIGTTDVTVTLTDGTTKTFTVSVSDFDSNEIQSSITSPNGNFSAGDKVSTGMVKMIVPVTNPDGSAGSVTVIPEVDKTLVNGDNEFSVELSIGGVQLTLNMKITVS